MTTTEPISRRYVEGSPLDLVLLDVNARFMTYEQFKRLCDNVRRDGCLTSTPLVWNDNGRRVVLSGNHRVKAAREVGLQSIGWLEIDQPLPRQRQVALQLSHNAIEGQDDPAVLKDLFNELEDLSEREYAGLDDKTLELLESVDVGTLNDAALDYATVQVVFLPHELDDAKAALQAAVDLAKHDERWLAARPQHDAMLDALETARGAADVGNTATALGIILRVFNQHLQDLREEWYDPETGEALRSKGAVPLDTVFGSRHVPPAVAALVERAVEKMVARDEISDNTRWRALELWAADYLAGA